ncbi:hypothetical protein EVJ20_07595 [Exiguobacterium sp. SH0S1]|uniref:SH3 domain-containing protein n=1 Tax=Exiguobacterium sp. SH0S1 TaxID=2510949 RepID=UPI00103C1C88|nr:hypothetical protein [Exiguobacterium sp. SH0S1]TCI77816.1 hypothetical protein EVJ20_07595 [Exiguobacterium sp. SH0S1]
MKQSIKRIGAGLLALSLVTASPNPMSFAPTTVSAAAVTKVFNKDTNVQAGAYRAAKVLKSVKQGEAATVLEVKGSWTKVKVGTVTGWVAGWDLSDEAAPVVTKVFNKDTGVQVGAFRAAKVLQSVKQGEAATVLEVRGSWTKVKVGTVTGWVAGWDLSDEVTEAYEAIEAFVLKAGRYQAAPVVANVPAFAKLDRVAVHGSWSEVVYNGKRGFVANWSIRQQTAEQLVHGKRIQAIDVMKAAEAYNPQGGSPFLLVESTIRDEVYRTYNAKTPKNDNIGFFYADDGAKRRAYFTSFVPSIYKKGPNAPEVVRDMVAVKKLSLNYGEVLYGEGTFESRLFAIEANHVYDQMHRHTASAYPNIPKIEYGTPGTFKVGDDVFETRYFYGTVWIEFE